MRARSSCGQEMQQAFLFDERRQLHLTWCLGCGVQARWREEEEEDGTAEAAGGMGLGGGGPLPRQQRQPGQQLEVCWAGDAEELLKALAEAHPEVARQLPAEGTTGGKATSCCIM